MLRTDDFDYDLPESLIAQVPAPERDGSRLLVLDCASGALADRRFSDLPGELQPGGLLVVNDSRVFPARVRARRPTGGAVELLLVRRLEAAPERWRCLCRASKALRPGQRLSLEPPEAPRVEVEVEAPLGGGEHRLRFHPPGAPDAEEPTATAQGWLLDWVSQWGETPLPPYIRRPDGEREEDRARYQTVYADPVGSVAAPTAGLHFTQALLDRLQAEGHEIARVTLHVGPGTFRPVRAETPEEHRMDAERLHVPAAAVQAIARARAQGRPVIAVGTTTVRALEGAAHHHGALRPGTLDTELFIRPGFPFQVVDGLITNFHLPRSTLLMLVSALAGRERVLAAYRHAVAEGYRFYSYGDAMLIR